MMRLRHIGRYLKQAVKIYRLALKNARIPLRAKLFLTLALGYLLLPFDLVPDFLLGIGQVDDLVIVLSLLMSAFRLIPKDIFDQYRRQATEIDVTP
ncbi:MAG: DUF1232 domain-containing protein [Candidatus Manganitrophus sp. SA1]|nr:DUF1232 domain-containing protein [Candidatus Manganitrophus morganii]